MKIWIITGAIANHDSWAETLKSGKPLLQKYGIEVELFRRYEISYTVGDDNHKKLYTNGVETTPPDRIFLYGACDPIMEGIEEALTDMGAVSINPVQAKRIALSKLKTAQMLAHHNIKQAKTLLVFRNTPPELIIKEMGLPLVMKPDTGFGGQGVELIHDEAELKAYLDAMPEKPEDLILAQSFVATSKGRDLRALMVNGKVYGAFVRKTDNPEEFRSNVHQGGHYEDYEITPEIEELCGKVAKISGLNICGLDLLFGEDGFLIGEINDSPGLARIVKMVGVENFIKALLQ